MEKELAKLDGVEYKELLIKHDIFTKFLGSHISDPNRFFREITVAFFRDSLCNDRMRLFSRK